MNLNFLNKQKEIEVKSSVNLEDLNSYVIAETTILNKMDTDALIDLINDAKSGLFGAKEKVMEKVMEVIDNENLHVEGYTKEEFANSVYNKNWGLDIIEDIYYDDDIYEIRINNLNVFVKRIGKTERMVMKFSKEEDVSNLIKRLIHHDFGVALNRSTPIVESMRKDNTRITALGKPIVPGYCLVLRKHNTFEITPENLEAVGTMSKKVWNTINLLYKGGSNILFSGNTGSGKTSKLRALIGNLHVNTRIVSIEKDRELGLSQFYPDMDIVELEEHQNIKCDMNRLFEVVLRFSPDVIVVGEFRGSGEVVCAIDACTRGHKKALATAHFNSPYEAIEGSALLMIREGLNMDLELAKLMVARAFNIVVQLRADSIMSKIKLDGISEVGVKDNKVFIRPLITWNPSTENYMGDGKWIFNNQPSEELIQSMFRYGVSRKEVEVLWNS